MSTQVTPVGVRRLLEAGIEPERIARLLVATGAWSEEGASDIVSTLVDEETPRIATTPVVGQASALVRD